jgi:hypothetical protein
MTRDEPRPHHPHLSIGECGGGVVRVKAGVESRKRKSMVRVKSWLSHKHGGSMEISLCLNAL